MTTKFTLSCLVEESLETGDGQIQPRRLETGCIPISFRYLKKLHGVCLQMKFVAGAEHSKIIAFHMLLSFCAFKIV